MVVGGSAPCRQGMRRLWVPHPDQVRFTACLTERVFFHIFSSISRTLASVKISQQYPKSVLPRAAEKCLFGRILFQKAILAFVPTYRTCIKLVARGRQLGPFDSSIPLKKNTKLTVRTC